jgi:hypothetical protein
VTREKRRKTLLLAGAGALAVVVALDRAGIFAPAGPESPAGDPSDAFLQRAALVERSEQLAGQSDAWAAALEASRAEFQRALRTMIVAPSPELAADRLRRQAETAMNDLGLKLAVSAVTPAKAPIDKEALRVVGLALDFDAPNPDVVFRLIDRLENLPETRAHVGRLSITGPGPGIRTGLRVSMEVQALALIAQAPQPGGGS